MSLNKAVHHAAPLHYTLSILAGRAERAERSGGAARRFATARQPSPSSASSARCRPGRRPLVEEDALVGPAAAAPRHPAAPSVPTPRRFVQRAWPPRVLAVTYATWPPPERVCLCSAGDSSMCLPSRAVGLPRVYVWAVLIVPSLFDNRKSEAFILILL